MARVGRAQAVAVGRGIADQEGHGLERPHHAVDGHAEEAGLLGHLVDGPLPVVDVEQAEDGESPGQSPDLRRGRFPAIPVVAAMHPPSMDCRPAMTRVRCLANRPRALLYDTSNITQQYRDIVLQAAATPREASRLDSQSGADDLMAEKVFANCTNSGPVSVYVKDGKIVRVRPLVVDESDYQALDDRGRRQEVLAAEEGHPRAVHPRRAAPHLLRRAHQVPHEAGRLRPRTASATRRTAASRRYERISWDEASDLVAGEITRVKETYGGSAISGITSSHHNWGIVGYKMGPFARFLNMIEFTPVLDNPDSWEGWHWGATHTYGFFWRLGMPEPYDMLEDALQNAEMIVYWSNDPDTTRGTYSGQDSALWRQWLKEKGVKMVFIDPFYNYTNAVMGGKWIAPRHGHRHGHGHGHRLRLDHRRHLRQGLRRRPHHRLRRVQDVRPGRDRRRAQDPGVGGRGVAASRPASSAPWPASGRPSARSSPAAPAAARAAPAGRPTAPSGPA